MSFLAQQQDACQEAYLARQAALADSAARDFDAASFATDAHQQHWSERRM